MIDHESSGGIGATEDVTSEVGTILTVDGDDGVSGDFRVGYRVDALGGRDLPERKDISSADDDLVERSVFLCLIAVGVETAVGPDILHRGVEGDRTSVLEDQVTDLVQGVHRVHDVLRTVLIDGRTSAHREDGILDGEVGHTVDGFDTARRLESKDVDVCLSVGVTGVTRTHETSADGESHGLPFGRGTVDAHLTGAVGCVVHHGRGVCDLSGLDDTHIPSEIDGFADGDLSVSVCDRSEIGQCLGQTGGLGVFSDRDVRGTVGESLETSSEDGSLDVSGLNVDLGIRILGILVIQVCVRTESGTSVQRTVDLGAAEVDLPASVHRDITGGTFSSGINGVFDGSSGEGDGNGSLDLTVRGTSVEETLDGPSGHGDGDITGHRHLDFSIIHITESGTVHVSLDGSGSDGDLG